MRKHFFLVPVLVLGLFASNSAFSQDTAVVLSHDMFDENQVIFLGSLEGWVFKHGSDPAWANPDLDTSEWEALRPSELTVDHTGESGVLEGWFRLRFRVDSTFAGMPLGWRSGTFGAMEMYLDGERVQSFGSPDPDPGQHKSYNPFNQVPGPAELEVGREYVLAFYLVDHHSALITRYTWKEARLDPWLRLTGPEYTEFIYSLTRSLTNFQILWTTALFLLTFLFWVISFQAGREYLLRLIAWMNTLFLISALANHSQSSLAANLIQVELTQLIFLLSIHMLIGLVPIIVSQILKGEISRRLKILFWIFLLIGIIAHQTEQIALTILGLLLVTGIIMNYVRAARGRILTSQWMVIGGLFLSILWMLILLMNDVMTGVTNFMVQHVLMTAIYLTLPISLLMFISVRYKEVLLETQKNAREVVQLTNEKLAAEREKQIIAANQKKILEEEVASRTQELRESLENLRSTQEQLVQQEKLASLGQLTAGIAHEIKNPLNFVNNFSDVSLEMIDEAREMIRGIGPNGLAEKTAAILGDIKSNLQKIHEHGSRADGIVKSMLQHSRGGSGKMEPTDVNGLVKEYVNLAYHGMRAGKNPINVDVDLQLDDSIGDVPLIAEDFSRVILNLCNNAFDAVREKLKVESGGAGVESGKLKVKRGEEGVESGKLKVESGEERVESGKLKVERGEEGAYSPRLTVCTRRVAGNGAENAGVQNAGVQNAGILIEIGDNGPGIPDGIRDKILQPFFTTKKGTAGTGLGLSITHDIVKAHGGSLQVVSTEGEGSEFTIVIPVNG